MNFDQVPSTTWVEFKEVFPKPGCLICSPTGGYGYIRKQAYARRHEPMTDGEKNAPRRMSQFFGGLTGRARANG